MVATEAAEAVVVATADATIADATATTMAVDVSTKKSGWSFYFQ